MTIALQDQALTKGTDSLLRAALRELSLEFGLSDGFGFQVRRTLRDRGIEPTTIEEAREVARAEAVAIHRHPCAFGEALRIALDRAAEVVAAEAWAADRSLHVRFDDRDEFHRSLIEHLREDPTVREVARTVLPWEVGGSAGEEVTRLFGGPLYAAVLQRVGGVKPWYDEDDE